MKLSPLVLSLALPFLLASTAMAARPPSWLEGDQALRVAFGEKARTARLLSAQPKRDAAIAWSAFQEAHGDRWNAVFDRDLGTAVRVYGRGIAAPGSSTSADLAERTARRILAQHLELLAPGSKASDFVLAANVSENGLRTVSFFQYANGMRVHGGSVSFAFKNDRLIVLGSEAKPNVRVEAGKSIDAKAAEHAANKWVGRDYRSTLKTKSVSDPQIYSLVRGSGSLEHYRAIAVKLAATNPVAAWTVWIDATNGNPIAREQTLKFADGTLMMDAPERWPGSTRNAFPAPYAQLTINQQTVAADQNGQFTWGVEEPATIISRARGALVNVQNDSGAEITETFVLDPGSSFTWSEADDELADAQLTTYIATHLGKARAKLIAPNLGWLDDQIVATVNMGDTCNAFSDGDSINFFIASRQCENTGRLPDVVQHELGHSIHAHAIIPGAGDFDTALSEGASDYFAATIANDHGMGRGFFFTNDPLRDIDESNRERIWPDDVDGDPHETGLIIGGALWDLRKALISTLGEQAGIEKTDAIWYAILRRSSDIPTSYVEALAADDDDGDLSNGTPNICDIDLAFSAHGLAQASAASPGVSTPIANGLSIVLPIAANATCPGSEVSGAQLTWQLRSDPSISGVIQMTGVQGGLGGTIPAPTTSDVVIQYRVEATLGSGEVRAFPDNVADPNYELYIGEVKTLYCNDFEVDPMGDGWTHVLVAGQNSQGADDWQWGVPQGTSGSGDPAQAYSGTFVFGNDLGGGNFNGKYQSGKTNALVSPVINTQGYAKVRLQYRRWLTVEDGFYDRARIYSNETEVWSNLATDQSGEKPHQDREWRFHDVDLSATAGDGTVQVSFEIESDEGLEFGGWTIDDFCIYGVDAGQAPRCGDSVIDVGEGCDDGNIINGDGCSNSCTVEAVPGGCGNGSIDAGEACDDGNLANGDGCNATCGLEIPNASCGNGTVDPGEACDDGLFDGTVCSPGCVLPNNNMIPETPIMTLPETEAGGCGCTSAETKEQELLGSLILLGVLALTFAVGRRREKA